MIQAKALCCVFLLSSFFIRCIVGVPGNGICGDGLNDYCCSNFEMVDGKCRECQKGFNSVQGETCLECKNNLFGEKCAYSCRCKKYERCDNVEGCVNDTIDITSTYMTTHNAITTSVSIVLSSTSPPYSVTVNNNTPTKLSKEIIIYCVSAGCLLLVICLGYAYHKYRLKQQSQKLLKLTDVNSANLLMGEISEENEEHYHYIDESRMVDSKVDPEPSGGYLEVVDSSSDTSIQHNIDGGYLQPYNALTQPTEAEVHIYLQKDDKPKSISSGSNSSLPYTDQQGYFHMYHKLENRCKSLPRDYESASPHGHILRNSNYNHNHSKNCLSKKEERHITLRHSLDQEEQHQCNFERTEPQFIQEANEMLPKNQGLLTHANKIPNSHQNKKNLTL